MSEPTEMLIEQTPRKSFLRSFLFALFFAFFFFLNGVLVTKLPIPTPPLKCKSVLTELKYTNTTAAIYFTGNYHFSKLNNFIHKNNFPFVILEIATPVIDNPNTPVEFDFFSKNIGFHPYYPVYAEENNLSCEIYSVYLTFAYRGYNFTYFKSTLYELLDFEIHSLKPCTSYNGCVLGYALLGNFNCDVSSEYHINRC